MGVLGDSDLEALLATLHAKSDEQVEAMRSWRGEKSEEATFSPEERAARLKAFVSDKLVALDRDKAEFCYQLCRATGARQLVEVGTSYGVSTLYLAAAVRDNIAGSGGSGRVIATEYEPEKAKAARANFSRAGLDALIELREGDLRETLKVIGDPVDFMLVDIWIDMARPALELVAPHLREGAIVICDNTQAYREAYADYFAFIGDPANGFRTMTLPFNGGLELSVRCSR
ncbi:MAG: class I SAM-dependent methyltransferase [Proteobacteria bacterium]|nr:class I SAM-dependent methyltransferase [Pseudomonadota bacterium]